MQSVMSGFLMLSLGQLPTANVDPAYFHCGESGDLDSFLCYDLCCGLCVERKQTLF